MALLRELTPRMPVVWHHVEYSSSERDILDCFIMGMPFSGLPWEGYWRQKPCPIFTRPKTFLRYPVEGTRGPWKESPLPSSQ